MSSILVARTGRDILRSSVLSRVLVIGSYINKLCRVNCKRQERTLQLTLPSHPHPTYRISFLREIGREM